MKCLYVGVYSLHCSDQYRLKGMFEAGIEVRAIDFRHTFAERGDNGLINDIIHCYISFQPDFIMVNKGEKITAPVLEAIKRSVNIPIFLFYGDKRNKWPEFIKQVLPLYDAFLINSDDEAERGVLKSLGAKRVEYHHTATDLDTFRKDWREDELVDVAFFGSNYNELFPESVVRRDWLLRLLNEPDIMVRLHGHGWGANARSVVFGENYARSASQAKIILGFNAFNNINLYTSNRAFNSMACGMFMSVPWKGCEEMFKEGKEIEYFRSYREMVRKIRQYKDDVQARRTIHEAGRRRLQKEHTYKVRAGQLVQLYFEVTGQENGNGRYQQQADTTVQNEIVG